MPVNYTVHLTRKELQYIYITLSERIPVLERRIENATKEVKDLNILEIFDTSECAVCGLKKEIEFNLGVLGKIEALSGFTLNRDRVGK